MSNIMIVGTTGSGPGTLTRLLRGAGYGTCTPRDGLGAVDAVEAHAPDLLLLDVAECEPHVMEVLESLPEHPLWKDIPVVVMTGACDTHAIRLCQQSAAKGFRVTATFSLSEMLDQVRQASHHVTDAAGDVHAFAFRGIDAC